VRNMDAMLPEACAGECEGADASSLPLADMLLAALDSALANGCVTHLVFTVPE